MDDLTDDELLADAVITVALVVLDRPAGDADGRRAFLEGFLRHAAAQGANAPAALGMPLAEQSERPYRGARPAGCGLFR
jgi:hypothetical protein